MRRRSILMVILLLSSGNIAPAEMIQGINMDFVSIGNVGNVADYTKRGAVDYEFSIGIFSDFGYYKIFHIGICFYHI